MRAMAARCPATHGWGMRSDSVVAFAAAVARPLIPLAIASDVQAHLASLVARDPHLAPALSAPIYVGAPPRNATLTYTLAEAIPTLLEVHHALTLGLGGDAPVAAALSPATSVAAAAGAGASAKVSSAGGCAFGL